MQFIQRKHLKEQPADWAINRMAKNRPEFVKDVVNETIQELKKFQDKDIITLLNQAFNLEQRRIRYTPWRVDPPNEKLFWKNIEKQLKEVSSLPEGNKSKEEIKDIILKRIVENYAIEIAGDFKPQTFKVARKILRRFLGFLFCKFTEKPFGFWGSKKQLLEKIRVIGEVDQVRELSKENTIVFLPTHSSNLDSVFIGYTIDQVIGMPAVHYGAGLNLFNAEFAAYFMNRLGAYKVDRRKKNTIYLETLKMVSRKAIIRGVHSLFFTGGTRSRNGEIEHKLKMGLLGTALQAQRDLLKSKEDRSVVVVPLTINYPNVLEGADLISDHLRRSIKENQEKIFHRIKKPSSFKKIFRVLRHVFVSDMITYVNVGEPLDVFGNKFVLGESARDKHIDAYFKTNGEFKTDPQRIQVYTKYLSEKVAKEFSDLAIVRAGQLTARASFYELLHDNNLKTAIELLSLDNAHFEVSISDVIGRVEILKNELIQNGTLLDPDLEGLTPTEIVRMGIKELNTFHSTKAIQLKNSKIISKNPALLYFYSNRLNTLRE